MRRVWRRYVRAELRSVLGKLMWRAEEEKQSCAASFWCSQLSMLISQNKIIQKTSWSGAQSGCDLFPAIFGNTFLRELSRPTESHIALAGQNRGQHFLIAAYQSCRRNNSSIFFCHIVHQQLCDAS